MKFVYVFMQFASIAEKLLQEHLGASCQINLHPDLDSVKNRERMIERKGETLIS